MRSIGLSAVLFLLSLSIGWAATPDKGMARPIWEWTDEERIQARIEDGQRQDLEAESLGISKPYRKYVIDGSVHPELFMADELFSGLIGALHVKEPEERAWYLARKAAALRRAGFDPDAFWKELEPIVASYFAEVDSVDAAQRGLDSAPSHQRESLEAAREAKGVRACQARFIAFRRAREHFGPALDRFLYTEYAPHLGVAQKESFTEEAPHARYVAGGCR